MAKMTIPVTIYTNTDGFSVGIYTEKEFAEVRKEIFDDAYGNDRHFDDFCEDNEFTASEIFFANEEKRERIDKAYREYINAYIEDIIADEYEKRVIEVEVELQ